MKLKVKFTKVVRSTLFPRQNRFTSAVQMMYWLLLPQKKSYRQAMQGGELLGVARGKGWGRMGELQRHRQPPPADAPSPDTTDPKISAFSNETFTSSSSSTVRTLERRTS
jgi:hypothetical protein